MEPRYPSPRGSIDLHQLAIGIDHPTAHRLARHSQSIAFDKFLGRERRPEVRIAFTNQRHRIIPNPLADPIVRLPADRLVPDRGRAAGAPSIRPRSAADHAPSAMNPICILPGIVQIRGV